MEDIDIHRIDSPSFFALGKLWVNSVAVLHMLYMANYWLHV